MDINFDSYTDIILISSPMYKDTDREGRVYACPLNGLVKRLSPLLPFRLFLGSFSVTDARSCLYQNVECRFDNPLVLRGDESEEGRFGSSVAVLPDLNTDGLRDVAVGAPLENDGQGCVYIFNGEGGARINPVFSQVKELKPFILSICPVTRHLSGSNLNHNCSMVCLRLTLMVLMSHRF